MAETGRHTNTVSGKRRPQNVYVDGNTVQEKSRKFLSGESTVSQSILFVKIRQNQS